MGQRERLLSEFWDRAGILPRPGECPESLSPLTIKLSIPSPSLNQHTHQRPLGPTYLAVFADACSPWNILKLIYYPSSILSPSNCHFAHSLAFMLFCPGSLGLVCIVLTVLVILSPVQISWHLNTLEGVSRHLPMLISACEAHTLFSA